MESAILATIGEIIKPENLDVQMKIQSTGKPESTYHAYLLRIWWEPDQSSPGSSSWRFSLENAHAGTRVGFRDLDSLLVFLNDLTGSLLKAPGQAESSEM
jgi:hypothetical protein